jgi:hypothetical protein
MMREIDNIIFLHNFSLFIYRDQFHWMSFTVITDIQFQQIFYIE